jgi:hypothetical protein
VKSHQIQWWLFECLGALGRYPKQSTTQVYLSAPRVATLEALIYVWIHPQH